MVDTMTNLAELVSPQQSALIVVDVQNDFCAPGGYFDKTGADLSPIPPALDRLCDFIDGARAAGLKIIFVRSHYDPVYLSATQNERRRRVGWDLPLCHKDSWGADFCRVQPQAHDIIVTKHRYDAFYQTDLDVILRSNGVYSPLFAGVATNVCVESAIRSAFMRDYFPVLVENCAAARTPQFHSAAVENVRLHFGMVTTSEEILAVWTETPAASRQQTRAIS